MNFWDSSALIALLVAENDTALRESQLRAAPDLLVWYGTQAEIESAICRRLRETSLNATQAAHARARLQILAEEAACEVTEFPARSDCGNKSDNPLGNQHFGHLSNAADVFEAILVGEAEVGVEAGAEVVAIEDGGEASLLVEDAFGGIGDGGFPLTGKAAEPNDDAALAEEILFVLAVEETVEFGMDVHGEETQGLKTQDTRKDGERRRKVLEGRLRIRTWRSLRGKPRLRGGDPR